MCHEAKAFQAFIGKDGLHCRHSVTINRFAMFAVDSALHPIRVRRFMFVVKGEGNLPSCAFLMVRGFGVFHALEAAGKIFTHQR